MQIAVPSYGPWGSKSRGSGSRSKSKDSDVHVKAHDEKHPSGRKCNECTNETPGLQGGVKITVMHLEALRSPTSALEKK
jgi:hypothetical protein